MKIWWEEPHNLRHGDRRALLFKKDWDKITGSTYWFRGWISTLHGIVDEPVDVPLWAEPQPEQAALDRVLRLC